MGAVIHTVTPNPALYLTYRLPAIACDDTVRARTVLRAAGGKGINVSRVATRLDHPTVAMGFVGGRSGDEIDDLLSAEGVRTWFTRHRAATRTNAIVQDDSGRQLRISGPGPEVDDDEVAALLDTIFELRAPDFLVLSGSLLRGMPSDLYVQITQRASAEGIRVLADADGDELAAAVAAGVFLIKPNSYELSRLTGSPVESPADAHRAALPLLDRGVGAVLTSLGPDGAVLAAPEGAWRAIPPRVEVDSAVGSGDSLVAGALIALADGGSWPEALRLGVACGTATATTPGTELCYRDTIERIVPQVVVDEI
jgi:6-phosphofructokinase 2